MQIVPRQMQIDLVNILSSDSSFRWKFLFKIVGYQFLSKSDCSFVFLWKIIQKHLGKFFPEEKKLKSLEYMHN